MTSDVSQKLGVLGRPMLVADRLACRRNRELLFSGLSFSIYPGQVVWLRGQNGRGKTSLMRLLVGLSAPDEGTLTWRGSDGGFQPVQSLGRQFVYVGHSNGLKDDLTVTESLGFLASLHGQDDSPDSLGSALRKLGLQDRAKSAVRTLSQGQRRRVAIARLALEKDPLLWILDEPFDALDPAGVDVVNSLILDHVARQGSVLLTSHVPLSLPLARVTHVELHRDEAA